MTTRAPKPQSTDNRTTRTLSQLIGQTITVQDPRTGNSYRTEIFDAKRSFGNLRLMTMAPLDTPCQSLWFEPTPRELASVRAEVEG